MVCLMQVILFAFASYFIADGQKQSGIVSVLFCGMVRAMCRAWPISCLVVLCMLLEQFGTTSSSCLSAADNGKLHPSKPHALCPAVVHGLLQKLGHHGAPGKPAAFKSLADTYNIPRHQHVQTVPLQAETFVFICEVPCDRL